MEAGCQLYENLTFRMRPAAIALNYRVTNIQNDVRQIIINIYVEKNAIQLTSVGLALARPKYVRNLGRHAWGALEGLLG